jgi:hypothetical protein
MRNLPSQIQDFRKRWARRRSKGEMSNTQQELFSARRPPDVTSARAKSTRHRKVTADHWNQ